MTAPTPWLTHAQRRVLEEVQAAGCRRYSYPARRPVEALEALGLVLVEREWWRPNSRRCTYTVRPAGTRAPEGSR